MRPIKIPLVPKTANTTCFNAQTFTSTGAATAPTTTVTDDGLAHQVTLISPVQGTLAGVTFTIVGTDCDGNALTESGITGPASNSTVTSTKYFKTVATIQPSATMGGLVVSVGTAAPSLSQTVPLDGRSISPAFHDVDVSGTVNFTVLETFENVYSANPSTLDFSSYTTGLSAKTATTGAAGQVPAQAARILINSVTNGAVVTWRIAQASQQTG